MDELIKELNVLKIGCSDSTATADGDQRDRHLTETIEKYAKTVLDMTWDQELVITSDEFRTENSEKVLHSILYLLDGIRDLCHDLGHIRAPTAAGAQALDSSADDYRSVRSVLGVEFAECLLWRKAGLIYAFCNCRLSAGLKVTDSSVTVEDSDRLQDEDVQHQVLQYLIDGIHWYRLFLSQRQPMDVLLSGAGHQLLNTTEALVAHNLFSDNHLLSVMYLSELCFWYDKYSTHWDRYVYTDLDVRQCGRQCLKVYINAVENHFKAFGWSCDKALQLLPFI